MENENTNEGLMPAQIKKIRTIPYSRLLKLEV